MARPSATATRTRAPKKGPFDNTGLIPVLARAVREVETAASRGPVGPSGRTKYQVIALLVREERARAKTDPELTEEARAETLKRLDGVATILAKTAARDTSLIALLEPNHPTSDA
ncbi:MAG TPA: ATP-dependent helicase, partial [Amnibacterium sp.]|nr:ATP-dependent helicase [Amnibacterium sp.]